MNQPTYNELGRLADMLSEAMIGDMKHALGGIRARFHRDADHRNYYVTGSGDDRLRWEELERHGLAVRGRPKPWIPGAVFHITDLGKRVLQLVEDS